MRRIHFSRMAPLVGMFWLSPAGFAFAQPGLAQRVESLEAQVAALTQQVAVLNQTSTTIDVDCDAQQRIQAALTQVQFRPNQVVIRVFGVCTENIVITRTQLLIRGGAAGAGIQAANPLRPVVRNVSPGLGSAHVSLADLTISGGQSGVVADFGTHVEISNCTIRHGGTGVVADHQAMVRISNSIVEDNAAGGLSASHGAHIFMSGGAVRNNAQNGVSLRDGATAHIAGGALITGNQADGIGANGGSMVAFGPATASGNGSAAGLFAGIAAGGGSTVFLWGGAIIDANSGNGIMLSDTSVAQKIRVEKNIQITNNTRWGISCSPAPAAAQLNGFNVHEGIIIGNGSGGINCPKSPPPPQ